MCFRGGGGQFPAVRVRGTGSGAHPPRTHRAAHPTPTHCPFQADAVILATGFEPRYEELVPRRFLSRGQVISRQTNLRLSPAQSPIGIRPDPLSSGLPTDPTGSGWIPLDPASPHDALLNSTRTRSARWLSGSQAGKSEVRSNGI